MNDKQQLAAMGEHIAEQAGQEQPLCMAKRIEELEAQGLELAELLRDLHEHIRTSIPQTVSEHYRGCDLLERIDAAMAGNEPYQAVPEDCAYPLHITTEQGRTLFVAVDRKSGAVYVGGNAEASDAAKTFLKAIGSLSLVMVPEGWQLVPEIPTEEMLTAGINAAIPAVWIDSMSGQAKMHLGARYSSMLAAAPKPESK